VTPMDYEFLRKLLKERSGLDLSSDKQYLVESRLTPLVRRVGLSGIAELVQKIKSGTEALTSEVVEAMTTNETFSSATRFRSIICGKRCCRSLCRRGPAAAPCGSGVRLPPPGKSPIPSRCASRNSLRWRGGGLKLSRPICRKAFLKNPRPASSASSRSSAGCRFRCWSSISRKPESCGSSTLTSAPWCSTGS